MHRVALVAAFSIGACAPATRGAPAVAESEPQQGPAKPLRVLVTGFNDWKELGDPPNVWRCRDNPSCRLLVGDPLDDAPTTFAGPLVAALADTPTARPIEWSFSTLPVTWGVAAEHTSYGDYDVVVHVGLGVYDRDDEVFVEAGAYNLRKGTDAVGRAADEPIFATQPEVMSAPPEVAEAVEAVDGKVFGTMRARTMEARPQNSYLCNETHSFALDAVQRSRASGGTLDAAFFVHIPQPVEQDWGRLADSVAGVVVALVADGQPAHEHAAQASDGG